MNIYLKSKGDGSFKKSKLYFVKVKKVVHIDDAKLKKIAEETVEKLKLVSPYESIAVGWSYEIKRDSIGLTLYFNNSYVENGANIALIVDIGHGTRGGKWVSGKNYIKEPIEEAYNKILNETWEELKSL